MAVVQWVTGAPLWKSAAAGDGAGMRSPALLRFASDEFMEDLAAVLAADPAGLSGYIARPVTFRPVPPAAPPGWSPDPGPLKLYQPVHGDFCLVAASLVCRLTGLPDHAVRPGEGERAAFVLRRVQASGQELAWVPDPAGGKRWLPLETAQRPLVADREELFPLFPVAYADGTLANGTRRLLVGLIPVSSRETFRAASSVEPFPPRGPAGGKPDDDPRWNAFDVRVIGPLTELRDTTKPIGDALAGEASAQVLLDLVDLLRQNVPAVWQALQNGALPPAGSAAGQLYLLLAADRGVPWPACLVAAATQWEAITGESAAPVTLQCDLRKARIDIGELQRRFRAAVPGTSPPGQTPPDLPVPKIEPTGEASYLVRCVYRRPACAPFPTDIVSEPTQAFAIAPVFDPDAPARQIRIPLPLDTSIRDLRKFPKNIGFVLSNQLRGQMNRVTDLKKALDGGLGDEEHWDLGVICQFSIPIITICALILLICIVFVLNIVFFWSAFFRICLPVPVRSKEGS